MTYKGKFIFVELMLTLLFGVWLVSIEAGYVSTMFWEYFLFISFAATLKAIYFWTHSY